jgi:hypothetical protein
MRNAETQSSGASVNLFQSLREAFSRPILLALRDSQILSWMNQQLAILSSQEVLLLTDEKNFSTNLWNKFNNYYFKVIFIKK